MYNSAIALCFAMPAEGGHNVDTLGDGAALPRWLARYDRTPVTLGESGASVERLTCGEHTLYIKMGAGPGAALVREEIARLRWLHGRLAVPELLDSADDGARCWMVMSAIAGHPASDAELTAEPAATVALLAEALLALHATPLDGCPFDHRAEAELARARRNVAERRVDVTDFDDERAGRTPESLLAELRAAIPDGSLRLTHGDACLPNVLFAAGRLSGWIDLGRAGVGDPYRDLALCVRSAARNLGPQWAAPLLNAYRADAQDPRIVWYQTLDELF